MNIEFLPLAINETKFKTITVNEALADIKNQKYKPLIDALPDSIANKKAYDAAKRKLPGWAFHGTFKDSVINANFVESSGLFHFDVDKLNTPEQLSETKKLIVDNCPSLYAIWQSPSGRGLKGLLRILDKFIHGDANFKKAFQQVDAYFSKLGVTIDPTCKDIRRLCFVCSDPDIYINTAAPAYQFDDAIWRASDKPKQHTPHKKPSTNSGKQNQYIARAVNIIEESIPGERHAARLRAGRLAGGQIAGGKVSEAAVVGALMAASDAISAECGDDAAIIRNAHKAIRDGIENGKNYPVDDDAIQKSKSSGSANSANYETEHLRAPLPKAERILTELHEPTMAKTLCIAVLLENIEETKLVEVCESLGWMKGSDDKPPKEKHFKVAIVHVLIETAKKHNWRIIHDAGFFYIYNGALWVALDDAEVKQLLKVSAVKMGYSEIECRNSDFTDKLFKQATQDGFFTERSFIKQSIINLRNGSLVIDQSGVNLKPFDYRDFLTHQLDFNHDDNAINSAFIAYLERVLPDADTRRTLQEVAGYLFVKGLKMEKVFFLFGTGANGKSVFFEVLNGVIGSDNISNYSLESLTDDKGYHRAMIKDKIVNYGTDIRLTKIDAGMFKTLASGEPIEARLPYRDPFMMNDYAKLIFNVNRMDSANIEHTHGFYRRLLIIPFNETIPDNEQDRDLHKKILTDKAGVLNWIIEGAEAVIRNRDIFISSECESFKKQFLKETDTVAMFESEIIIDGQQYHTHYSKTVAVLYEEYTAYCKDVGQKYPLGRNNFSKRMETLGYEKTRKESGWYLEKNFFSEKVVNDSSFCQESATDHYT